MGDNFEDKVDETLQEDPIKFDVTVDRPGFLHKIGLKKRKRTFVIDPPPLRTLSRLSREIQKIEFSEKDVEGLTNGNLLDVLNKSLPYLTKENYERVVRTVVIAITHRKPSKKLIDFLGENMKPKELHKITSLMIQRFDLTFFLLSLTYLKGISVYREDSTRSSSSEEQSEPATAEAKS